MKSLTSSPSLGRLYARAAFTGPLHRGNTLPDSVYALADQAIDPARLAAYQRICGFRVSDDLPPTYLHVLAFPLSVALMVEQSFPFPLLSDVERVAGQAYETVRHPDEPSPQFAKRRTYLIDPDGIVRKAYRVTDISSHADQVLADLAALQNG